MNGTGGPDWTAIGTFLIALYAAVLSTWQAVQRSREDRPKLKVTLSLGHMIPAEIRGPEKLKLFVTVANTGKVPVSLESMPRLRLSTRKGKELSLNPKNITYRLPHRLEPQARIQAWIDVKDLAAHLPEDCRNSGVVFWIVGLCRDATGKDHKSIPYRMNIETCTPLGGISLTPDKRASILRGIGAIA
jgi:hypothetical protein